MNRNLLGNLKTKTSSIFVANGCRKQGRGVFILLLMALLMPFAVWGQITPTTDSNGNGTIEDSEKILYLIQTNQFESFYITPKDNNNLNTVNLPHASMLWYFLEAENDNGTQYYYIINNSTGKYICNTDYASNGRTIGLLIFDGNSTDKFKFKLVENNPTGATDYYNINIKPNGSQWLGLNKQGGNASDQNGIRLTNSQYINQINSRWKFIPYNGTLVWPNPPFTVSTDLEKYYYQIHNKKADTYYISTNPSTSKVIYSSTVNDDMAWYFKEAASDTLMKYYYIINPEAGDKYMYYDGTVTNGSNQSDAVSIKDINDANAVADRFLFVIVQAAVVGNNDVPIDGYYMIVPKLLIGNLWSSNSLGNNPPTNGCNMGIISGRGADIYSHWSFETTVYPSSCSTPTIIYSSETGKITITSTTADAVIHYTTDGTEPSSSEGELYSVPFDVSSPVTVKAIATKEGYDDSEVATVFFDQVATPIVQNNGSNAISITTTTEGATIYYTTDGSTPTTASTLYIGPLTENVSGVTINAIAVKEGWINSNVGSGTVTLKCAKPVITKSGDYATISCTFPASGVTIFYTKNGGDPNTSSLEYTDPIPVSIGDVIKAIATAAGYENSDVATKTINNNELAPDEEGKYHITNQTDFDIFVDMANSTDGAQYHYVLDANVTAVSEIPEPFKGIFDGNYHTITGLSSPLFNTIDGGTVKNVKFDDVNITTGTNVGAVCNEATGATKIYNCGILSGSITGTVNVGGLVGLINSASSVRVVNCYNYANVSGGTYAAGIVGKNEGSVGDVRIALCMMYGNISDATNISPVYTGNHIDNVKKFTEYNFFLYSNERDENGDRIVKIPYTVLNDQLSINEEEYLTRFPFYLHTLNTHRELAAFFLFGASTETVNDITSDEIVEIGHWVVKKDLALYPIVERWESNTKKVLEAPTPSNILTEMGTNGFLGITVKIGNNTYTQSTSGQPYKLPITDMDEANFDYTWGKVVLPYANEFEINTNYDLICTGWKITKVTKGSTDYTTSSFTDYNFADRNNPQKDIYSESNPYIFAQGGYYIVPYGVTAIEITANFATAYYLSDAQYEMGYTNDYTEPTGLGGNVYNGGNFHGKTVYNNIDNVLDVMGEFDTPHSQAIVLVGNYHFPTIVDTNPFRDGDKKKALTLMSIDADNNQEPDYAFYSVSATNNLNRPRTPALRFDFVALIPVGMAAHVNGSRYYPGLPIWNPSGWFEMTETSLTWTNQFELASSNFVSTGTANVNNYRIIINSGYYVQMVRSSKLKQCNKLSYAQIGGKAYIKEYYPGSHSANAYETKLVPVNVTGGEIEQCFMTGYGYKKSTNSYGTAKGDNIYFWCAGGKIGKFLGAFMETPVPATSGGNVDMTAKIDHALIKEFYGGGTSPLSPVTGNIDVTIDNSRVDFYCGGPEFGDMTPGKTVRTTATNTIFGEYYGAGFGGTAIVYFNYEDYTQTLNWPSNSVSTTNYPDTYFGSHYYPGRPTGTDRHGRLIEKAGGIGSRYKFEYIVHSYDKTAVVARFYTGFANFDFATTGDVTNTLKGCTVLNNFFGAGCQGKVNGTVTSTLTDCTVYGSAYGAGYKASANEVEVYPTTDPKNPPYALSKFTMETGIFSEFKIPEPEIFQWKMGEEVGSNDANKELYTTKDMTTLGDVNGKVTITLNGNTTVNGSLFGGGFESKSLNDTEVYVYDHTHVFGNIYGGGNKGKVGGNSSVTIEDAP